MHDQQLPARACREHNSLYIFCIDSLEVIYKYWIKIQWAAVPVPLLVTDWLAGDIHVGMRNDAMVAYITGCCDIWNAMENIGKADCIEPHNILHAHVTKEQQE